MRVCTRVKKDLMPCPISTHLTLRQLISSSSASTCTPFFTLLASTASGFAKQSALSVLRLRQRLRRRPRLHLTKVCGQTRISVSPGGQSRYDALLEKTGNTILFNLHFCPLTLVASRHSSACLRRFGSKLRSLAAMSSVCSPPNPADSTILVSTWTMSPRCPTCSLKPHSEAASS
jgi:hypothetical protein